MDRPIPICADDAPCRQRRCRPHCSATWTTSSHFVVTSVWRRRAVLRTSSHLVATSVWRRRRCHDDIVSRLVQRRHCWHGDRSRHSDAVIHTVLATVLVWTMMPSSAKWRLPARTSGCSHCVTAFCRMPIKTLVTPQILIDIHPEVRILTRPHTLGWSTWQWKKNFTESLALFLISFVLCYFITVQNIFQVGRDLDVAQSISNY